MNQFSSKFNFLKTNQFSSQFIIQHFELKFMVPKNELIQFFFVLFSPEYVAASYWSKILTQPIQIHRQQLLYPSRLENDTSFVFLELLTSGPMWQPRCWKPCAVLCFTELLTYFWPGPMWQPSPLCFGKLALSIRLYILRFHFATNLSFLNVFENFKN